MNIIKVNELNFSEQDIFVGIDMHLKNWKVDILVDDIRHKTMTQPGSPEILVNYVKTHFPGGNYHFAYEAGFSGFWAHYYFIEHGIDSIVVHAADIPTTDKDKKSKNDVRDCRKIAQSLRSGQLEAIHVPDRGTLEIRQFVRHRQTLVTKRTRIKNQIKSKLNFYGISKPDNINCWSKKYIAWLRGLTFITEYGSKDIEYLLDDFEYLTKKISSIEKEIKKLSRKDDFSKDMDLLVSVPGIGETSASIILFEIGDINRFQSLDKLSSYFGIVPSEHSSGEKTRTGHLSGRGNKRLKHIIIEASWKAIEHDPALMKCNFKLKKRMNHNEAIIRIARKLLSRIMFVLKNKQEYRLLTL